MSTVLVVDDKEMMRDSVAATLQRAGFTIVSASDGDGALEAVARKRPDAIITDLRMPGMTGVELASRVAALDPDLPVVVMTAFATVESAVQAMKEGAFDYITKPFEGDELVIAVKRAVEHARLRRENAVLRATRCDPARALAPAPLGLDRLVGDSEPLRTLRAQIAAIAPSHGTVLVIGESGAGKEVIARALHESSPRRDGPFLAVNCAALSESLLESELFGHEKGAFTGADSLRKGRFELADGGTLLLDEVSEVPPQVQAKLLRVLQERAFERVGSSRTIGVDVRVIATSNRDLPAAVAAGQFRQDLFYRLNVLPLRAPPLRDRLGDVPALCDRFLADIVRRDGRPPLAFDPEALALLRAYQWPGNGRQLQNICERAAVLGPGPGPIPASLIRPWLAPAAVAPQTIIEPKAAIHLDPHANGEVRTLELLERETIVATLGKFRGHRQRTAEALGIGVRTLGLKLKRWKQQGLVSPTL